MKAKKPGNVAVRLAAHERRLIFLSDKRERIIRQLVAVQHELAIAKHAMRKAEERILG